MIWPKASIVESDRAGKLYRHLLDRKKKLYRALYDFTFDQCGACVESGCACKDRICQHVEEQAARRGFSFTHTGHALRFIGPSGCIIPPHLRETCTIYLCGNAQGKTGFDRERYEKLKGLCQRIEIRLMQLEDEHGSALPLRQVEN
jgi:hypothetical protein